MGGAQKFTISRQPGATTAGTPSRTAASKPLRSRGKHTTHKLIGPLGRRDIEHASNTASCDQAFHRSTTSAGRMEHKYFIPGLFENSFGDIHTLGRIAEHAGRNQRPVVARRYSGLEHPAECAGAREKTSRLIRLMPATSTILGTRTMSLTPT